jgi:hypothetical protein
MWKALDIDAVEALIQAGRCQLHKHRVPSVSREVVVRIDEALMQAWRRQLYQHKMPVDGGSHLEAPLQACWAPPVALQSRPAAGGGGQHSAADCQSDLAAHRLPEAARGHDAAACWRGDGSHQSGHSFIPGMGRSAV